MNGPTLVGGLLGPIIDPECCIISLFKRLRLDGLDTSDNLRYV